MKFHSPLLPDEQADVSLELNGTTLSFKVTRGDQPIAQGAHSSRMQATPERTRMTTAWQQRSEVGNDFWLRVMVRIATSGGRRIARLVHVADGAVLLRCVRGPERRSSRLYLERVLGRRVSAGRCSGTSTRSRARSSIGSICSASASSASTFARTACGTSTPRSPSGKGVLLIGSHLGSFDALRVLSLERPDVTVRIVLDIEHSQKLSQFLNALNPALAASIINAREGGPAAAIAIKQALDNNAIVALLADRGQPNNAMGTASFLGYPAPFPHSPWLLAAAVKSPVMLAFGLYAGGNRYDLHFETFADSLTIERSRRAEALAEILQRFADRLAHYARLAPYNWFNFYDFWNNVPDPSQRLRRMLAPLALGALLTPAISFAAIDVDSLLKSLAHPAPAVTPFVEVRFSKLLDQPIVVEGQLEYHEDGSLVRAVSDPFKERTEIKGETVSVLRAGKSPRKFSLKRAPELRSMLGGFSAVLGGGRGTLDQDFNLASSGEKDLWKLSLTPKSATVGKYVKDIVIQGSQASLAASSSRSRIANRA